MYFTYTGETLEASLIALALFLIAGITDYLDGYFARKTQTESSFGALLDLLADKLLVCTILVWLVFIEQNLYLTIPSLVIVSRELMISSIRQYIVETLGQNRMKVSNAGKSKTTVQFVAISLLIIADNFGMLFNFLSIFMIWVAAFISLFSIITYIKEWKEFF